MSSSGLDWKPVLQKWLQKQNPREIKIFQELFDASFTAVYLWLTQNLTLTMKVLQCNIIQQVLEIKLA